MTSDELWIELERLENTLGASELLCSLALAMGDRKLEDLLAYICRVKDIETKCKENE